MNPHSASLIPYETLYANLEQEVAKGNVVKKPDDSGLALYCYSKSCVYDKAWNDTTVLARGLVLDTTKKRVAAYAFPKFFNYGEQDTSVPDLPFETFEKLDGSLIIAFYHNNDWRTATKGSLGSSQAVWALERLQKYKSRLAPGFTYLFEAIYAENRIVVNYDYEDLVLLGIYDREGYEIAHSGLHLHWHKVAKRYAYNHISDLMAAAEALSANEEGWVLRFSNGHRLKIKGAEYKRIHALVSGITPLNIWRYMLEGQRVEDLRKQIPEEFWADFDQITSLLADKLFAVLEQIVECVANVQHLSDKELGLCLSLQPEPARGFLFAYRNTKGMDAFLNGRSRRNLFNCFRPDGNRLEGYRASYAVARVLEEV